MTDFSKPQEISDLQLAFPAHVVDTLMPSREFCEGELEKLPREERDKWIKLQRDWFYKGLPESTQIMLKDGIDGEKAMRHLAAIQGSFEPKHEHKEAAVAYLASLWFEDITY